MRTSLIALLSAILFLGSCTDNQKAVDSNTDTIATIDTAKPIKSDTVALKKSNRVSEDERDQKIMDEILKNKKIMK